MSNSGKPDLIGELFSQQDPAPQTATRESRTPGMLLIAVLAAALALLLLQRCDMPWSDWGKRDYREQQGQKEDRDQAESKAGYLYIIRERQFPTIDENESVAMIADFCGKQQGLEFRDLDDDEESSGKLKAHAKSKGVEPPCVIFRPKDGELSRAIKLPSPGKIAELTEVFKP